MRANRVICFAMLIGLLWGMGRAPQASEPGRRPVTDMAGRTVPLPEQINRVVTLGSLPVLNSFVFTMGEGRTLINGLADFALSPHWRYQFVFAPHLAHLPSMQQPNRDPNLEAILLAKPDVVLTMHRASVDLLESNNIPTIFLAWREPEDVKACMTLLGEIFHKPTVAERYRRYFDDTLTRIGTKVNTVPAASRPRVLYFHPETFTQPRLIAEWWIPAAGGISVTHDGRTAESRTFTLEQVILWTRMVPMVTTLKDVTTVYTDPTFRQLKAAKRERVYVAPVGAHTWAHRTAEQPLTVLWAAKILHPDLFSDLDLGTEVKAFYRDFFGHELTDAQVTEILSGTL